MRLIDLEGDTNFTLQNQSAVKGQKLVAACRLFSRGVIFTRTRVSLALLSLRKNGGLLVVYSKLKAFLFMANIKTLFKNTCGSVISKNPLKHTQTSRKLIRNNNGWQLCKPYHTVFFNKDAYGYPDNYKRRQKLQKHRALAKNVFF